MTNLPRPVPPVEALEGALMEAVVVDDRWRVRYTSNPEATSPYDGEGFGATLDDALRAAIGDAHVYLFEPGRDPHSIYTEVFGW